MAAWQTKTRLHIQAHDNDNGYPRVTTSIRPPRCFAGKGGSTGASRFFFWISGRNGRSSFATSQAKECFWIEPKTLDKSQYVKWCVGPVVLLVNLMSRDLRLLNIPTSHHFLSRFVSAFASSSSLLSWCIQLI